MTEKVTVIIVTYNGMLWLEKCIKSIVNSSDVSEIVIVDNNSTDGTIAYIKNNFPKIVLLEQGNNLGFGQANNLAISYALKKGTDYFFLLNQDACLLENTISSLITASKKNSEYGILSPMHLNGTGNALDYNFSTYISPSNCKNLYSDIFLNTIKKEVYQVQFVNAAAWLLSRKCIELVGGFNPSFFHYGEDDNYIQRVKYHKLKVGVLPISRIYHDREIRDATIYFKDEKKLFKRKLILKASNPSYSHSFRKEYMKLFKDIIRSIFYLKPKEIRITISKLSVLNSLDKKGIIENKIKSSEKNTSFLDV